MFRIKRTRGADVLANQAATPRHRDELATLEARIVAGVGRDLATYTARRAG